MSGGAFDYSQYRISDIIDEIQKRIDLAGKTQKEINALKKKTDPDYYHQTEMWPCWCSTAEEYKKWKEEADNEIPYEYSPETVQEFKNAVKVLRQAQVYANRIDWLISGDDGEREFHERLKEELSEIESEAQNDR